jgi:4-hydroxyphenylpyruvate dioxygenase-like putative hemolysin
MLDSFIISATPYDDLHKRYDDGTWDREKFAEKHILFQEQKKDYDYLHILFMSMK